MAELTPEQIAKGYYTDISSVEGAIDKFEAQRLAQSKQAKEKQDKLYQGIKDVSSVLDNKFTATGTAADPILLSQINKMKTDLTQGIVDGKISPTAAYITASGRVADVNNLAGTISQYRQNVEKKIAEIKKDRPEINSELLMNDVINAGLFDPQTGQVVTPNSNYDYVSTLMNQDRSGRYVDKGLLNKANQDRWKDMPGAGGFIRQGNFTYDTKLKPGQTVMPGDQGGFKVGLNFQPVGFEEKENIVKGKGGKAVKQKVKVGGFPGATDDLVAAFENERGFKTAAFYEVEDLNRQAESNPEFKAKWDKLSPEDKYRVGVYRYAEKLGEGGSYVKDANISAQTDLALRQAALAKAGDGQRKEMDKYSGLVDAFNISTGKANPVIKSQASQEELSVGGVRVPVYDFTNLVSKGLDKNLEDGHGHLMKFYYDEVGNRLIINYKNKKVSEDGNVEIPTSTYSTKEFDLNTPGKLDEAFGTIAQSAGVSASMLKKLIQGQ